MKYINNINNLTGKEWLKNAVNFWEFDNYNIEDIYDRFLSFCYKNRTSNIPLKNICKCDVRKADFSFNYVDNIKNLENVIKVVNCGAYNSYHIIFLKDEIMDNIFLPAYFTTNLDCVGLEYRGKFVIQIKSNSRVYLALMFLNRKTTQDKLIISNMNLVLSNKKIESTYVIESRTKMDKYGLAHPAPFSYIDIKNLAKIEDINNKTILDPFLGVGSTIIGTYETNYNIGIELNKHYIELLKERFQYLNLPKYIYDRSKIICGNSLQEVDNIDDDIDIVITSPPYFNILKNKTSGVRTDKQQSRQGIEYYSDDENDIGNINEYDKYLETMSELFYKIKNKLKKGGKVFLIISDFTINKKEKDIHSDFVKLFSKLGFCYLGTSYIKQNQKTIYPFGYPFKLVINHIYQYIVKFEVKNK